MYGREMANFIKINIQPLQNINSLQMQYRNAHREWEHIRWKKETYAVYYLSCLCFSVCGGIKMKGSFVYATMHLFRINNIASCCCCFYSSFSIFRNGQWKWHEMTYLQIGSNRMSLTIMIFMSASFTLLCAMTTIL